MKPTENKLIGYQIIMLLVGIIMSIGIYLNYLPLLDLRGIFDKTVCVLVVWVVVFVIIHGTRNYAIEFDYETLDRIFCIWSELKMDNFESKHKKEHQMRRMVIGISKMFAVILTVAVFCVGVMYLMDRADVSRITANSAVFAKADQHNLPSCSSMMDNKTYDEVAADYSICMCKQSIYQDAKDWIFMSKPARENKYNICLREKQSDLIRAVKPVDQILGGTVYKISRKWSRWINE